MTPADLIERALAAVDGDQFELARQLGFENVNTAASSVSRWRTGRTKPSYDHTMRLLEIAGILCANGK